MSQNSSSPQSAVAFDQAASLVAGAHDYALSSELAKLSLPATFRDENKKLAWANSICFLFLLIGLVGLKPPKVVIRQLPELADVVPVIFTPPEEPPPKQPEVTTEEPPEPTPDAVTEAPVIATVVAADASQVAFAVPVKGPVILAPARFAPPPPAQIKESAPPKPSTFIPSGGDGGRYPDPSYPRLALLERQQGKLTLYVVVDPSGTPTTVEVKDSCGYPLLDRHAVDWIKTRWQWPPGPARYYYVPIIFQIK